MSENECKVEEVYLDSEKYNKEYPTDKEVYIKLKKEILVTKVSGPDEIDIGKSVTYTIDSYNMDSISDEDKKKVKWRIEFYDNSNANRLVKSSISDCSLNEYIFYIENDSLTINEVPDSWTCYIGVYPYIKKASVLVRKISLICPCQKEEMIKIRKDYENIINQGRKWGNDLAADMLQHWLDGSGEKVLIHMNKLRKFFAVKSAEKKVRKEIENGITKRINDLKDGEEKTYYIAYEESFIPEVTSELYYASGASNLIGRIVLNAKKEENTIIATGTLEFHWADPYDWHYGLSTWILGIGTVEDYYAKKYEDAGCAKSFGMYSFWHESFFEIYEIDKYFNKIDSKDITWGSITNGRAPISERGSFDNWETNNKNAIMDGNHNYYIGIKD